MAILLKREDVQQLLDMPATIEILEQAFAELSAGRVTMPQHSVLKSEQGPGVALFMPAFIPQMISLPFRNS